MNLPLPVYVDRPVTVPDPDVFKGVVYVSVHDAEYLRQRAEWKRKIRETHTDRGGTNFSALRTIKQYDTWKKQEAAWYAKHGLTPPISANPVTVPRETAQARLPAADGRTKTRATQRLLDLLLDGNHHTTADCRALVGPSAAVYVDRLRTRGFDIVCDPKRRTGLAGSAYRLIGTRKDNHDS